MKKLTERLRKAGTIAALVGISALGGAFVNEMVRAADKHNYHVHLGTEDDGTVNGIGIYQYRRSTGGMHHVDDPLYRIQCGAPFMDSVTNTQYSSSKYNWEFTPDEFTFKGPINEDDIFSTIEPQERRY